VADPLLDNPRAFVEKVASVLGGSAVSGSSFSGFLSSDFDPFLNHLFAAGSVKVGEIVEAVAGRPTFVWLADEPTGDLDELAAAGLALVVMHGMTASTEPSGVAGLTKAEIVEVRSLVDLDGWYEVYSEVFGADARARKDWYRVYDALGPSGDRSLSLLLAKVDGLPAATGAAFYEEGTVGLYCFTTREPMRGRGLASALVQASHAAARARGIERALLQATDAGRPIYARAGYREARMLPVIRSSPAAKKQPGFV
jgi:GNAT superfamily N-acetyltransferase